MPNTTKSLPMRMSRMLGVPVCQNDGRPTPLCRHRMNKFSVLEWDLESLKQKARVTTAFQIKRELDLERKQRILVVLFSLLLLLLGLLQRELVGVGHLHIVSLWTRTRPKVIILNYYSYYSVSNTIVLNQCQFMWLLSWLTPPLVSPHGWTYIHTIKFYRRYQYCVS